MSEASFERVEALFLGALELPEEERAGYLEEACEGDEALLRQIARMLSADSSGDGGLLTVVEDQAAALAGAAGRSRTGDRIGNYELLREVGRGGMSVVYEAARSDAEFEQRVAIKLIGQGLLSDELRKRLVSERQIMANLQHPNIARLLDGGSTADGMPYVVMELIEGLPIDRYCDQNRLSVDERIHLLRKVCSAVHFAHRNLVVHRDLKPSNVLVDEAGDPKLLDFGIAKLLSPAGLGQEAEATVSMLRMGTPGYASPEQLLGEPVTTASDVYSLGVLLYGLLTGRKPYGDTSSGPQRGLESAILNQDPVRPSVAARQVDAEVAHARRERPASLARKLSGDLDNILLMCLRKEPERRYGSVEQLAEELDRYLAGHTVIARRDTMAYRTTKFVRRHRWGVLSACAALVMILATGLGLMLQRDRFARERDRAELHSELLAGMLKTASPSIERGSELDKREFLDSGLELVAKLADEPLDQAALRGDVGEVYEQLGHLSEAQELYLESLDQRRELLDEPHLDIAESLFRYARASARLEEFDIAEDHFQQAYEMRRELLGNDHMDVAAVLSSLSLVRHETGRYDQAEEGYREALAMAMRKDPEDRVVVKVRYNLALLLHDRGEYEQAEQLFRLAMEGYDAPGDSDELAELYDLLGQTLHAQGRLAEAEEALREGMTRRSQMYGNDHYLVARSANHLGDLLRERGDVPASEELLLRALEVRLQTLGEDSAEVAESLHSVALLHLAKGEEPKAEELFAQSVELYRSSLSDRHPFQGRPLADWGALLAERGDCADAEPLLETALSLLSATDLRAARVRSALGLCQAGGAA